MNVIKVPFCHVNESLKNGVFPDLMKVAKVLPLHKSGEMNLCDNFRPISLLPVMSKVIEKIVFDNLTKYLDKNKITYGKQYGFSDAVSNLVGEGLKAFNNNEFMLCIFIDLKKAFDSISHPLILSKLKCIGVERTELEWFRSYLSNRRQLTKMNNNASDEMGIEVGVPQGLLLSVLIFKLYVNDMFRSLKYSQAILYANGTTIYITGKSLRFLRVKMQSELNALSRWLKLNRLVLNTKKTKCMVINKEGLIPEVDLFVENE